MIGGPLPRAAQDECGAVAIETAIIAPILALLCVGAFQASMMVVRQSELQSVAEEAQAIVLASSPDTEAEMSVLKQVIVASSGLSEDRVTLAKVYRCDSDPSFVTSGENCEEGSEISTFVRITLTDTYTPQWTEMGIGGPINYNVVRAVQLS